MPALAVDVAAVVALVTLLVVAFVHPPEWVEASAGVLVAVGLLALGAVDPDVAADQVRELFPVVAFLCAILVVATLCAVEGVFIAVGSALARGARNRPVRMLVLTFAAAAAVTAVLSLDATVVLLTPVAVAAATSAMVPTRPVAYACVRMANSASLLLPVSNLTNLLTVHRIDLGFVGFVLRTAPAWLAVIAVEYVGVRFFFRHDLAVQPRPQGQVEPPRRLPRLPVAVLVVMLVGFAVGSAYGVEPAWVAGAAALVLVAHALRTGRTTVRTVLDATHLSFAVFVLGLGVVVAALADGFLADLVRDLLPEGTGLGALLGLALLATVLANLVNNLPATLLIVPLVAPLGTTAVLATLVGLNVGSGLTYPGSLANLLWRRGLARHGDRPSARDFHRLSLPLTPVAVAVGVTVLWAWAAVIT